MARRIAHLIEEHEDKSKQLRARYLAIKVERTQEGLKNVSMQKRRAPTPEAVRDELLPLSPVKDPR